MNEQEKCHDASCFNYGLLQVIDQSSHLSESRGFFFQRMRKIPPDIGNSYCESSTGLLVPDELAKYVRVCDDADHFFTIVHHRQSADMPTQH